MICNVDQALNSDGLEISALPDWVCQATRKNMVILTNQNGGYGGQRAMKNGDVVSFTRLNGLTSQNLGISPKWMLKGSKNGGKWWTNESRKTVLGLAIIHLPKCGLSNTKKQQVTYFANDFYGLFWGVWERSYQNIPKWSFQLGVSWWEAMKLCTRFEDSKKSSHWNR